jgi:hypothetical protein
MVNSYDMKKIINRYFDFLGVENEGKRRLLIIIISIWSFYLTDQFGNEIIKEFEIRDDIIQIIVALGIPLILSLFSIGLITKIITWVKEGFDK